MSCAGGVLGFGSAILRVRLLAGPGWEECVQMIDNYKGSGAAGGILALLVQATKRSRAEVSRLSDCPAARVTPVFNRWSGFFQRPSTH